MFFCEALPARATLRPPLVDFDLGQRERAAAAAARCARSGPAGPRRCDCRGELRRQAVEQRLDLRIQARPQAGVGDQRHGAEKVAQRCDRSIGQRPRPDRPSRRRSSARRSRSAARPAASPRWRAFPARPGRRPARLPLRPVSCRTRSKTTLGSTFALSGVERLDGVDHHAPARASCRAWPGPAPPRAGPRRASRAGRAFRRYTARLRVESSSSCSLLRFAQQVPRAGVGGEARVGTSPPTACFQIGSSVFIVSPRTKSMILVRRLLGRDQRQPRPPRAR